jgi:Mg2+-importing ATPase
MTFALLIAVFHAPTDLFRTAWFIETLLSELLFTLSIRTQRPFWSSRPSTCLAVLSLTVALVALALPWLPFATAFGFVPPPLPLMGALGALLLCYLVTSDLAKMVFVAE